MSSYNTASVKIGDIMSKVVSRYFLPLDIDVFLANMAKGKTKTKMGWVPEITVERMCAEMVANDLGSAKRHALLKKHSHEMPESFE
jgi:GDPmannose 4,6-dehydratase